MKTAASRSRWAAIGAAVAVTLGAGGIGVTQALTETGEKAIYAPIEPCRLADLRPAPDQVGPRSGPLGAAESYKLSGWGSVGDCTLPTGTTALALNVTALNATLPTFLALYPADAAAVPNSSNLNPVPGQPPTPNAVNVDLDAAGEFFIYNLQGNVNVIIDVVGVFDDHNHDDRYYTEDEIDAAIDGSVKSDDGKSAYAWSCSDGQAIGTPYNVTTNCGYSYNPSGTAVTVTRTAVGRYSVSFPGLSMSQGHVQVTAYGASGDACNVVNWGGSSVNVACFDPAGAAVNEAFTVLAID